MSQARSPNRAVLPAITADEQAWQTPRAQSRIDVIEDRLQLQERSTQNMVDRAYRIKEDIVETLNLTHGTWAEEKRAREMLQEHIRTITDVVRKISRDIVYLEEQIRQQGGYREGTQNAVKNLEMHHVAGVTDLRGRVTRCDATIAKLSTDMRSCYDNLSGLGQQHRDLDTRVTEKLQALDQRLSEVMGKLDKWSAKQEMQIKHVETESGQQVTALDTKTSLLVEDTRNSMNFMKDAELTEREKLETRMTFSIDKQMSAQDRKLDKTEKRFEEALRSLSARLLKAEETLEKEKERRESGVKAMEGRMSAVIDVQINKQGEQINKLKREMREGFASVHESISSMKEVLDGKRRLMEEQLRKEIGQVRKMVVLV